ncbi:cell division protein FtsW [Jeotgalibacillus alimentarius]|uniref:Cell division protein FtsW n=1 Tax=Jeotgalibacillus alimentarius TaxID=135826 RepID=A0A0C2VXC8_9BACL|nr:FtsW/RodA/SpoVE family cell cycle protein [Jeotgalibacillus alimentarius]KIL53492.1 cell division protein FtsW [Jeotgalibacillus alimentarius]
MNNKGDHFLKEVTNHIKSKEARDFVTAELTFHLKKAKGFWQEKGLSDDTAEEKAVEQMGSPVKLGQELNKLHKPKVDWMLIVLLTASMGLGFLPIITLDYTEAFLMQKIIIVLLGVAAAVGMMLFDYRRIERFGWVFYILGACLLLTIRYFPTTMINGQAYLQFGIITLESLMALPFFFLAWASFLNNSKMKIWHLALLFIFSLYLFFSIPNLSTALIYTVMVFVMLWWSQFSKKTVLLMTAVPFVLTAASGVLFFLTADAYQMQRLLGFLSPEKYEDGAGYLYLRLEGAFSSAGWFGTTGGFEFIPSGHTDYVFATMTFYYGYVLAVFLVLIFSLFAVRMIMISRHMNSSFGKLLLTGSMTLFIVQFVYNIAMMLGLLPLTSISLPFISYGLMPTLFNAFLIGIVLSVYRRKSLISGSFA